MFRGCSCRGRGHNQTSLACVCVHRPGRFQSGKACHPLLPSSSWRVEAGTIWETGVWTEKSKPHRDLRVLERQTAVAAYY